MVSQKIAYFFKRLCDMGLSQACWLVYHRLKKRRFIRRWRRIIQRGYTYRTWHAIAYKHHLKNFPSIFLQLQHDQSLDNILTDPLFIRLCLHNQTAIKPTADNACNNTFSILGFGTYTHAYGIAWHRDVTTPQASPTLWASEFYADITIPSTAAGGRQPDIKVAWEMSRMQHLFALGMEYGAARRSNNLDRCHELAATFVRHVTDWIDHNPFLRGVAWTNPMEVAIRSINLIWGFNFFKHHHTIEASFWQRYVEILYDHRCYLESNWEVSDRPNNHLLADMVGYLYLCSFFSFIPSYNRKKHHVIRKLFDAFDDQILDDGTSYEGSSSYHTLVTELLLHAVLLTQHTGGSAPARTKHNLERMLTFAADCTDQSGASVTIGDDDSGIIVSGLYIIPSKQIVVTYPNFGLTIIQKNDWFITFRHPTFSRQQPSGHFHDDLLSITVSIKGVSLLVDPGTYLYTSDADARNYFRSFDAHNTFFIEQARNMPADLFQLQRTVEKAHAIIKESDGCIEIHDTHDHFLAYGLRAHRALIFDSTQATLSITDWWQQMQYPPLSMPIITRWRFHCSPTVVATKKSETLWKLQTSDYEAELQTTLSSRLRADVVSARYGAQTPSITLEGDTTDTLDPQRTVIRLTKT